MILVTCDQSGGWAEANDELGALQAARALLEEARRANSWQGYRPTVTFECNGSIVRGRVPEQSVWTAIGRSKA